MTKNVASEPTGRVVALGVGETVRRGPDPLLLALARFVQALDQRYPDGLEQMRSEALASGANMPTVRTTDGRSR
jgi:hypothetical protein